MTTGLLRTRWAAIGAAVAVTLGAGGIGLVEATKGSGDRPIFVPIEPCRLTDTRPAPNTVGARSTPLQPNETYVRQATGPIGQCNLPTGIVAVSLNVTAVNPSMITYLTLFPGDKKLPKASHLNPAPGQPPTPNAVEVGLDSTGQFKVYNFQGTVNVIIDVVGYYDHHHHDDRYYTKAESDARYLSGSGGGEPAFAGGNSEVGITTTDQIVATISLDTPRSGRVLVSASAWVYSELGALVRCSISQTTSGSLDDAALWPVSVDAGEFDTIAGVRGFVVDLSQNPIGGPIRATYDFVCDTFSGSARVGDAHITAQYFPDP